MWGGGGVENWDGLLTLDLNGFWESDGGWILGLCIGSALGNLIAGI